MNSPYSQELEIAISALKTASSLSQSINSATDKGVVNKDDAEDAFDPVTIADFAIQALLAATFHHHFPADGLVGEESAQELRDSPRLLARVWELLQGAVVVTQTTSSLLVQRPETPLSACDLIDRCASGVPGQGRVWVFDPIDGTKTYVRGEMYAINIALLVDGKQVLSAVACPNLSPDVKAGVPISDGDIDESGRGSILFAAKDHGAYIRPLRDEYDDNPPRRLGPHPETPSEKDLRFVCCSTIPTSGSNEFHAAAAKSLGMTYPGCDLVPWVVRWGALALGLGNTTIWVYNRHGRSGKIWDHAGAMLLFEETGGKVTDVYGRDIDLGAGRHMTANFGFVASLPALHKTVLQKTHETLRQFGREDVLRAGEIPN